EVYEEVGLHVPISGLVKVIDNRRVDNRCRRPGGDYHDWTVFEAKNVAGELIPSAEETNGARWYSREELQAIAYTTLQLGRETLPDDTAFEPIWLDFLTELNYINQ